MKRICTFLFIFAFIATNFAQNNNSLDGWHLGGRMEGDVVHPTSIHSERNAPFLQCNPSFGWAVGIEASYHFAKYFGVSVGLDFGTATKFKNLIKIPNEPTWGGIVGYANDFKIPINLEVHVPFKENWHFYSSAGICFSNIGGGLEYDIDDLRNGMEMHSRLSLTNGDDGSISEKIWSQRPYNISIDAVMKLGFYYTLPYKDVIRFGIVGNFGLFNKYAGTYVIYAIQDNHQTELDKGQYNYRYNSCGIEVAYIHCFKSKPKESK